MKGIIFTTFSQMVEETFNLDMLDELLEQVKPKSDGIYISGETYEDAELFSLVRALSTKTGVSVEDLIRSFGSYAFKHLVYMYPKCVEDAQNARQLLLNVHGIIHVEVRKLHPDAQLPTFRYETPSPNKLTMFYHSSRKLYALAEGLIDGVAQHYGETIERKTTELHENGETFYRFDLIFK